MKTLAGQVKVRVMSGLSINAFSYNLIHQTPVMLNAMEIVPFQVPIFMKSN